MGIRTLEDLEVDGATVGCRIDINSPLAPDGTLADDARLRAHVDTVAELADRGARVAVIAHQGRPGGEDFATLRSHADRLNDLLDLPVSYVDAPFGTAVRERLANLPAGSALVVENARFYSEEYMEFAPAEAAETHMVADLASAFDAFVNDAFATAHRSQPTVVGFAERLPAYAGRVMERELDVLGDIGSTPRPRVYVLGGAKVEDSLGVARNVCERGLADRVLTTGVVANVCLIANGIDLGDATSDFLYEAGYWDQIDRAQELLDTHDDRIELPRDVAVERDGDRAELPVEVGDFRAGEAAWDIGSETVSAYRGILADAGTVILNGPAGVSEKPGFAHGTRELFEAATAAETSIVGGGDTAAAIRRLGVEGFTHVSTGGGACLQMLCGERLPGVEGLHA